MTSLTIAAVAILVICSLTRHGFSRAMAIGGGTPIGAAIVFGDIAIPTFYFAALGAVVALVVHLFARTRDPDLPAPPRFPGSRALLCFVAWSIVVTVVAPQIFAGVTVQSPDAMLVELRSGPPTTSNIAQIVYLIIGACVVFYLARSPATGPHLIGLAAGIATVLSFWRFTYINYGVPFPEGLFDNSPAFKFIDSSPGGGARFRGIFSEPSGLATSSLVTIAYTLSRAVRVVGWRRVWMLVLAAMAGVVASVSTSGTFVVASVALLALVGLTFFSHVFVRRHSVSPAIITLACFLAVVAVYVLPLAGTFVESVIDDKVGSTSYEDRTGTDILSLQIVTQTFGFGVGLGAHRPSSFVGALVATTGIVGFVLFATAVWSVIRHALPRPEYRPVIWALAAILITKAIASPDLADTSGLLWLCIGVLARACVLEEQDSLRSRRYLPAGAVGTAPLAPPLRRGDRG